MREAMNEDNLRLYDAVLLKMLQNIGPLVLKLHIIKL